MMKVPKNIGWVKWFVNRFLYGDVLWAHMRLLFLLVVINLIAGTMAAVFEGASKHRVWHNLIFPSLLLTGILWLWALIARDTYETDKSDSKILLFSLGLVLFLILSIWAELRYVQLVVLPGPFIGHYLLAPLAALTGALMAASRYVQNIYSLENYDLAVLYVFSSFCGIAYPELIISNEQMQIDINKVNRLDVIGGPGYITVTPSDAILIQDPLNGSKVYSAQRFFVPRFGKIASIVSLRDQRGSVSSVSAITKDGITVTVHDIELRYRIWSGSPVVQDAILGRNSAKPYPFDAQAVRDYTYNRSVTDKGLTSWFDAVKNIVVGKITDYITEHQFDQIVTPNYEQGDPRMQIRDQVFSWETQSRLKDIGTQLLWCDIGHFEEDKSVLEQRLETWSAKWMGSANVIRAEGEAQRIAYRELGRAEAQADMLISIIHAFDDIDLSKEKKDQNIRNVILMRTAQVLESLAETKKPLVIGKTLSSESLGDSTNKEEK